MGIKNLQLTDPVNGSDDVLPVSPRRHWVGVAVCQPGAVVVATTIPRHVTKDIRMLRRHVGQRNSQRRRSVHRQSQLELHVHAASVYRYLTTVLPAIQAVWRPKRGRNKVWCVTCQQINCLASPMGGRTLLLKHVKL